MKSDFDLLAAAQAGYSGNVDNAALFSSAVWLAHVAGGQMRKLGVSAPVACRISRGYSVRLLSAGGGDWLVKFRGPCLVPSMPERLD
jgi:hypothetical protein